MAMTFSTLKSKVATWLHRTDLTADIPFFIQVAQRFIERRSELVIGNLLIKSSGRWKYMQNRATSALASGESYLTLPSNYKEAISLWAIDPNSKRYRVNKTSVDNAMTKYPDLTLDTGTPEYYASHDPTSEFLIRPTTDQAYTMDFYYYAYSAELSGDSDSNWLTNNAPEILLYGALVQAYIYLGNDQEALRWGMLLKGAMEGLEMSEIDDMLSEPPVMQSDYVV